MAKLLAMGNPITSVVPSISEEFGCSPEAVYRDYRNMDQWGKKCGQGIQLSVVLNSRLDILNRTAMENVLGAKKPIEQARALEVALKITKEQIKLEAEKKDESNSVNVFENRPLDMPFACDPEIKRILIEKSRQQQEEYDARKAAREALEKKRVEEEKEHDVKV